MSLASRARRTCSRGGSSWARVRARLRGLRACAVPDLALLGVRDRRSARLPARARRAVRRASSRSRARARGRSSAFLGLAGAATLRARAVRRPRPRVRRRGVRDRPAGGVPPAPAVRSRSSRAGGSRRRRGRAEPGARLLLTRSADLRWRRPPPLGRRSTCFFSRLAGGVVAGPGGRGRARARRGSAATGPSRLSSCRSRSRSCSRPPLYASNGSDRFKERYLFVLLPLIPLAFGLYLRRGRPARAGRRSALAAAIAVCGDRPAALGLRHGRRLRRLAASLVLSSSSSGVSASPAPRSSFAGLRRRRAQAWRSPRRGLGSPGGALAGALVFAVALSIGASRFAPTVSHADPRAARRAEPVLGRCRACRTGRGHRDRPRPARAT